MTAHLRVTAIVVNWNGAGQLTHCLEALMAQDHPELDIIVVDNASTDGSRDLLIRYEQERRLIHDQRGEGHPIEVIWNDTNRGFAGAVNQALDRTDAPAVLVSNFDVRPRADYVRRALAGLDHDDRVGAVQGKLLRTRPSPSGEPVIDTTGHVAFRTRLFRNRGEGEIDRGQWDEPGEVFGISGALALYRREMLDDVAIPIGDGPGDGGPRDGDLGGGGPGDGGHGGEGPGGERRAERREVFDEDLFAFWEDVDLDWRAAQRGWTVRYEPSAVADHERGGAGPRRTTHVEQLNFQNRLLTLIKNDSPSRLLRDLPGFLVTTLLKAAELAVTVPRAFFATFGAIRLVPRMVRKRRTIQRRATVPTAEVVDRWFGPFDYGRWVRTWWRRIRGVPPGA